MVNGVITVLCVWCAVAHLCVGFKHAHRVLPAAAAVVGRLYSGGDGTDFSDDVFGSPSKICFVGNLPFAYDASTLESFAIARGIPAGGFTARIEVNKKTGRSRGFGYLDFPNHDAAVAALRSLEGAEVDGRPLKLDLDAGTDTPSKGRRPPLTSEAFSCFLGNLPFSCAEGDVSHLVTTAVGDVPHKVRLAYTAEGRSRGFGHVDFGSDETVEAAVAALDGMEVFDRQVSVRASVR